MPRPSLARRLAGRLRPDREPARPGSRDPVVGILGTGRTDDPHLARWVAHHVALVGADRVLLLLEGDRAALPDLPCPVHVLPAGVVLDEPARWRLASSFAAGLLSAYDWVAALRTDELLAVEGGTLTTVLAGHRGAGAVRPRATPGARAVLTASEAGWTADGAAAARRVAEDDRLALVPAR